MKNLLDISLAFNKQEVKQDIHLCILRSDYMIDKFTNALKLVEYNTIASSFGCLCQKVTEVQNYIRDKYEGDIQYNYDRPTAEVDPRLGKTYIRDLAKVFEKTITYYKQSVSAKFPEHNTEK